MVKVKDHRVSLCVVCLMSVEPVIVLGDDMEWRLAVKVSSSNVVLFDGLRSCQDGVESEDFNLFHLDELLTTLKERADTQNSDGQLRLRYSNGA